MSVKQSSPKQPTSAKNKTQQAGDSADVEKSSKGASVSSKTKSNKLSTVSGWIQDATLEAPTAASMVEVKPGDREIEFSVAMRRRQEGSTEFFELRGRALIHAHGNVMALAEASFVSESQKDVAEAEAVHAMYPPLRNALQSLLAMAGHEPPLPESLESAA